MYDDMWLAGKCMYKLEPVVADGGTLIIYAPHITEVSYTHGQVLDQIGYHRLFSSNGAASDFRGVVGAFDACPGDRHFRNGVKP
jgi:hypothetical protein